MNAINDQVVAELDKLLDEIDADKSLRGLIVTGAGRSFVAGADIANMSGLNEPEGLEFGVNGTKVFAKFEHLDIPVIAAVNGFALGGGCELAMACDYIIASEKAKFGQPEVGLGIIPGFGGTQRLPRKIGKSKAMRLIFSGDVINAQQAYELGLADMVVPPEELMDKALEVMASFTKNAPQALKYAKMAINYGIDLDLEKGIAIENKYFSRCFATEDQKEGMKAFLEKRKAEFKNR